MKGMPLPFDFEGKGAFDLDLIVRNKSFFTNLKNSRVSVGEPNSVLDSARISSTSSSQAGAGASTDTAGLVAASDANSSPRWHQDWNTASRSNVIPSSLEIESFAMEDWESVLSESPCQEQSIHRWIMGDVEDPTVASLNKALQIGGSFSAEFERSSGFGASFMSSPSIFPNNNAEKIGLPSNSELSNLPCDSQNIVPPFSLSNNTGAIALLPTTSFDHSAETKPPLLNSRFLVNQLPQNPSFCFSHQQNPFTPQAKRDNSGGPEPGLQISKSSFLDTGQQQQPLPHYLQQWPMRLGRGDEELGHGLQEQQAIVGQLYEAAELVQTGNPVLAQGILARLNHQLSPIGKPLYRAAFYCKEALQLLLQTNNNNHSAPNLSPFNLIFKIAAYKSFSEISPLVQFANFTCNQALLEVLERFDRVHIVDFDIGYGGQWASLMQELVLRTGGAPSLKITAIASSSTHHHLELGLTRQNLIQFASEVNISFEFEVMSIDSLNSCSWSQNEAVAVNLPIGCFVDYQLPVRLVLNFVKQLTPRIVVSVDRGCDRTDLSFANHIIHTLHSYSNLLESIDTGNVDMDALNNIERHLIQPEMEKIVLGRFHSPEKMQQHWRTLFLSSGFSPVTFSNFTESQAECVVKRRAVGGFHVEKRQCSLVLCWQRKELISASAWRC